MDPNDNPVTDLSDDPNDSTDIDTEADGEPDDPTIVPLTQAPALTLDKVGDPQTYAAAGDVIAYTYTVTNAGNVTLTAPFSVSDDVITAADIDCSTAPASLAPTESFACTATYSITQADIDAGSVTNTATAEGVDPDDGPVISNEAIETVAADLRADVAIVKAVTDGGSSHVPGSPITYALTVTNNGPSTTTTTTVSDTLPTDTSYVSATPSTGSCSAAAGVITCELGSMAIGDSVEITVVVDVDPASTGLLTNTATVSSNLPDVNPLDNTSTVVTSPTAQADLVIDKVAPATYVPGTPVTYTIDVTNDGPSTATDVVVTDTLPVGVTFDAASSSVACTASAGTVTCDPVVLGPGESVQYTIVVDTTSAATATLVNTASVQSPVPDPDTSNNQDSETTTADPQADLSIVKTGPTDPVAAGEQFSYSIAVTNAGPSDATNVSVDDPLPAGLVLVTASVSGGSATETCAPAVSCDLGTVPAGATETITVVVQVGTSITGDIINTATTTTTTAGDDPADNTDDHTVTVVEESDLTIAKTDSTDPAVAGELVTYTLTASNAGPSQATSVTVTDTLPAGVTFDSASAGCVFDGSTTVTCDAGTVGVGVPVLFDVTVRVDTDVPDGTVLLNNATVSAPSDADPTNNTADEPTTVAARADVAIVKASSPKPFVPGQELTYTITVLNIGPSDAQNVQVSDPLPTGFFPTGITPAECSETGGQLDCTFPTLSVGQSTTITVIGQTDPAAATLTNTVTVTTDTTDPNPSNDTATDVNTGDAVADLTVVKSDSADPVVAGAPLSYTITVTNNGPSDAANVTVDDTPPAGFIVSAVDRTECDTSISCVFPVVAAGASEQLVVTGVVDAALADTGDPGTPELSNTVTVASDTIDGDPGNNSDTETTDVVESADVVLTKIGQGSDITPGEQATFAVEVVNAGPSDADGVIVTDTLPAGLTLVSATGASCSTGVDPSIITCDLGTVAAGDPPTVITLVVDVAPDVLGGVVNEATVTSTTPDPAPENNGDTSEDPTAPDADLSIEKVDLTDPVTAGTQLSYQLTVRNGGPSVADAVTVTDTLPAETAIVSSTFAVGSGSCTHDGAAAGGVLTCDLGALPPGAVSTITVIVDVDPSTPDGSTITNDTTVSSTTSDPVPADNADNEDTAVVASADVGVTKVAAADPATPGEAISYSILVRNNGPSDALDVAISDSVPAGLTVTAITGASCVNADPITCDLGTLAPGDEIEITIEADIEPSVSGSLVNAVTVTTSTDDPNPDNDVADSSVPVQPVADLAIDKTGPATIVAGTQMTYAVVVSNLGPSDAQNVVVSDTLPAGVTLVSTTIGAGSGTCSAATCTFPTVPAGGFASVTVVVDVDPFVADGTTLVNEADVTSTTPDPDDTNNADDHPTAVAQVADLSIVKAAAPDPFVPGQALTYTLVVTNAGPSAAVATTVTDPVPAGLTVLSATPTAGTCSFDATTIGCDLGDLDDGQQVTITVIADTDPSITATVTNTATVDSDSTDPNLDDNTGSDTAEPTPTADLQVVKSAAPATVTAGETITYSIVATNLGTSTALAVELVDSLPAGVSYLGHASGSVDAICVYDGPTNAVRCTQAALLPAGTITVDVTVTVDPSVADGATIENTAGVSSPTPDPILDNNTSTEIVDVVTEADVSIIKTLVTDPLVPGTSAQYELVVGNAGPSDAQAVTVTDSVPGGLTIGGVVATVGSCSHDGTNLTCDLGAVAAGSGVTITVDVTVASDVVDDVVNTASVTTATSDPDPTNDTSTTVDTPTPSADLVAIKTTISAEVVPGETVEYLITVANGGPSDADGVVVSDVLPAGLTALSATPTQGTCAVAADSVDCTLGSIAAGASVNVTVTAAVAADLVDDITNTAATSADTADPDLTNNTDTTTDPVAPRADLVLTKTVDPIPFVPGLPVTYTIMVTNDGPSDAAGVAVTDVLPAGVTPTSASTSAGTCTIDGSTVDCDLGTIAVGASVTITIVADTDPALDTDITNGATTGSDTPDPDPDNDVDSATTDPAASADLSITKDAPAAAVGGDEITYDLVVSNAGPSTATDVVVTDDLPVGVTFLSASPSCSFADPVVTCSLGSLAPGDTVSLTVTVELLDPDEATTIANTAVVTSTTPDTDETDNEATDATAVEPAPSGTLSGVVWNDIDVDGILDAGEPGIGGVTVTITGDPDGDGIPTVITVVTNDDGTYSVDLPPGEWTTTVDPSTYPPELAPTTPLTEVVIVVAGETTEVETGLAAGVISGVVWNDIDGDGVIDPGEADIPGVRVDAVCAGPDGVLGTGDDVTYSAITASPYVITGVPVGETCRVEIATDTLPDGYEPTFDLDGTLDHRTIVTVGAASTDVDFGYRRPGPSIAFTGASSRLLGVVAATLLLAGAALLTFSGRRRPRSV